MFEVAYAKSIMLNNEATAEISNHLHDTGSLKTKSDYSSNHADMLRLMHFHMHSEI